MRTTNSVIAFDMKDRAQVALLAKALEPTPAQRASLRFRNACAAVDAFIAKHLGAEQRIMWALGSRSDLPAGVSVALQDEFRKLAYAESEARFDLMGGAAPALAMAAEAA